MALDEEQVKALRKLKKNLLSEERSPDRTFTRNSRVSSAVKRADSERFLDNAPGNGTQLHDLFERLATVEEGIECVTAAGWMPMPLNQFDAAAFGLAMHVGQGPRKIALGFPRVPVGTSTWLAVAIMVARVFLTRDKPRLNEGAPQWIVIASRERVIRDTYFSQRVKFTDQAVYVSEFPAYRLRRDGRLHPISLASPNPLSSPILFYHFDPPDRWNGKFGGVNAGLIIAELSESDSRLADALVQRLESFRSGLGNPKTVLVFNSFDDRQRHCLEEAGYEMLHVRPAGANSVNHGLPTLAGAFADYSYAQQVAPEIIDEDHGISAALYEAALSIVRAAEAVETRETGEVVGKWWRIWRTLKDLAVPLDSYERYRMHAQGRGSLEVAIDRVATSASRLHAPEARTVQAVAPTVADRLRSVYKLLSEHQPKAERLLDFLKTKNAGADPRTLVVLGEKSQADALREYLLFKDVELLDRVPTVHLAQAPASARRAMVSEVLIPGAWAPWHDSLLLSVGAGRVRVLLYKYEASLLLTRLEEHIAECAKLGGDPILNVQQDVMKTLNTLADERVRAAAHAQVQVATQVTKEIEDGYELEPEASGEDEEGDDTSKLTIVFTDGSSLFFRPQSELLLVTEDGVESVFASNLAPGDTVALIPDAAARSIFYTVLSRVSHLIHADPQVIELWRSTIRRLVFGDPNTPPRSVRQIVREVRRLGSRRVDLTIRNWFKGSTLAPQDTADIARVLELAGVQRPDEVAKVVRREIDIVRNFNRRLGRRIRSQLKAAASGELPAKERIDFEIDEAIEVLEYRTVERIVAASEAS